MIDTVRVIKREIDLPTSYKLSPYENDVLPTIALCRKLLVKIAV